MFDVFFKNLKETFNDLVKAKQHDPEGTKKLFKNGWHIKQGGKWVYLPKNKWSKEEHDEHHEKNIKAAEPQPHQKKEDDASGNEYGLDEDTVNHWKGVIDEATDEDDLQDIVQMVSQHKGKEMSAHQKGVFKLVHDLVKQHHGEHAHHFEKDGEGAEKQPEKEPEKVSEKPEEKPEEKPAEKPETEEKKPEPVPEKKPENAEPKKPASVAKYTEATAKIHAMTVTAQLEIVENYLNSDANIFDENQTKHLKLTVEGKKQQLEKQAAEAKEKEEAETKAKQEAEEKEKAEKKAEAEKKKAEENEIKETAKKVGEELANAYLKAIEKLVDVNDPNALNAIGQMVDGAGSAWSDEDKQMLKMLLAQKLQNLKQEKEAKANPEPKPEKPVEPVKSEKKVEEAIQKATPETRNDVQKQLYGWTPEQEPDMDTETYAKTYQPTKKGKVNLGGAIGELEYDDYTDVAGMHVVLQEQEGILDRPRPNWIPEIKPEDFKSNFHSLCCARMEDGKYLVMTKGFKNKQNPNVVYSSKPFEHTTDGAVLVSASVAVAAADYYTKVIKETMKQDAAKSFEKSKAINIEHWKKKGYSDEKVEQLTQQYFKKAPVPKIKAKHMLKEDTESGATMRLVAAVHGMSNYSWNFNNYKNEEDLKTWKLVQVQQKELKYKANDIAFQKKDNEGTYAKAQETSYGDSGTKDSLYETHGVKVKKQNGKEIKEPEVNQIESHLNDVYSVFGNKAGMAKKWGLKISHSGDVLQHASTASGIYFPKFKAIGVTAKHGNDSFGFTLAHEFAHFMDNYVGKQSGEHFHSDKYGSTAHKLVNAFRDNYHKKPEKMVDYLNRSCECFARAFEMYHAIKTGKGEEHWNTRAKDRGAYPTIEKFNETVAPIIEQWLQENDHLMKSAMNELQFIK